MEDDKYAYDAALFVVNDFYENQKTASEDGDDEGKRLNDKATANYSFRISAGVYSSPSSWRYFLRRGFNWVLEGFQQAEPGTNQT